MIIYLLLTATNIFYILSFGNNLLLAKANSDFNNVKAIISKGKKNLDAPLKSIYNLDDDQLNKIVIGLYVLANLTYNEKVTVIEKELVKCENKEDAYAIKYNLYTDEKTLRYLFVKSFTRDEEITLRGTPSVFKTLKLIKNPPQELIISDVAKEIIDSFIGRSVDPKSLLSSKVGTNFTIVEFVVSCIPQIYSLSTELEEENFEFYEKVKECAAKKYTSNLCTEVTKLLKEDHSKISKEFCNQVAEFKENLMRKMRSDVVLKVLKGKLGDNMSTNVLASEVNKLLQGEHGGSGCSIM